MLEKVKIGGMEYSVKEIKFGESDGNVTLGECHYETAKILINENISEKRKEQTLIHEMVHAMLFEAGSTEYDNEDLVNQLGLIMYQVLKDNDLTKFYKSEDEKISLGKMLGLHNSNDVFEEMKKRNNLDNQF